MARKQKMINQARRSCLHYTLSILLFWLGTSHLFGQKAFLPHFDKEVALHSGLILPHSKNFGPEIQEPSFMVEVALSRHFNGFETWHDTYGKPDGGLAFQYFRLRNDQIFGDAIAVLPFFQFWLRKEKKTKGRIRLGAGLAYLTRPYNGATNPENNVIGSHINNTTNLRFDLYRAFSPQWQGFFGIGLLHFSNGSTSLPNLGINIANIHAGLRWNGQEKERGAPRKTLLEKGDFITNAHLTYARRESAGIGGPKYGLFVAGAGMGRMVGGFNRLSLQATYEYNSAARAFIDNIESLTEHPRPALSASRFMLSLEDEFRFGKVALVGELGAYVVKTAAIPFPVYTKLSARYFFLQRAKMEWFATLSMKSHITVAEYISFGVGTTFY